MLVKDGPYWYEIIVSEPLDLSCSGRFYGLTLTYVPNGETVLDYIFPIAKPVFKEYNFA